MVSMAVQAEAGPDRRQAAEDLVAGEAVAAVDALGPGGREQDGGVVAGLAVAGGEDLAARTPPPASSRSEKSPARRGRRRHPIQ